MNLPEAINALELAVKDALELALKKVVEAASSDDKTPLGNALALSEAASLVGTGEGQFDVVIFADLNELKRLNYLHGLDAGDAAISKVGELINRQLVEECQAKAYRRSGDEFVILLSSRSLEQFKNKLSFFASCSFPFNEEILSTSASFGYAVSRGEYSFADLLAKAESACKKVAKYKGGGAYAEWSEKIEPQSMSTFRDRCVNCDATFVCDVPDQSAPEDGKLLCCPCCGESLGSDMSTT